MKGVRPILAGVAAFLAAGCGAPSHEGGKGNAELPTLSERVESALGAVKTAARSSAEEQAEIVLAELARRLDKMGDEAGKAAGEAGRKQVESARMELEELQVVVREKLAALRDDTGNARANLERDVQDALTDLRAVVEEAGRALADTAGEGGAP